MFHVILQFARQWFCVPDGVRGSACIRVGGVRDGAARGTSSLCFQTAVAVCLCAIAVSFTGCGAGGKLPVKSSKEYSETVSAFYTGLAALQVGDDVTAESKLAQVTRLAPGEPAGWANWGVLAFRQRNFDVAAQRYERARDLASKNDQIYYLLGILQSTRGNSKDAIADWRKAVGVNPQNYRAAYQLAQEVEREGGPGSDAEFQSLIQNILKAQPDNLAALLELARAAAKRGDASTLKTALAQISARAAQWPPEVQQPLATLQAAAADGDMHAAATRIAFLRNTLMRIPEFRESLAVLQAAPGEEAEPFTHFLRLQSPVFVPAPADLALTFTPQALANLSTAKRWEWIGAVSLGSAGPPAVVKANGREVRLSTGATFPFPGGPAGAAPLPEGILPIDFNYDFNNDFVLAGAGGVRLMRQDNPKQFTDVTAQAKLPKAVTSASYTGAWAVDIEADGDLDIVLGAKQGLPLVLRNNGDGTFTPIYPFAGVTGLRALAWADFDGDGNPDAALVDGAGRLHVFHNERQAQFRELPLPANFPLVQALSVADVDDDGVLDLLAVQSDGAIVRISDNHEGKVLDVAEIARVPGGTNLPDYLSGEVRLRVADLDNNGALDLWLTGASLDASRNIFGALIWLADEKGKFVLLEHPFGQAPAPGLISGAADLTGDGRLDLLALSADGQPLQAVNHGSKDYHWQVVRPHAKQAVGDQRINPFGVGGEIEIRSGLLVQKQPITGPQIHFGLGNQTSTDVVRVVWPNGTVRAEFGVAADTEVVTEQRLKASCPFLFAYNGKGMEFIKDAVPWGSAIGLRINTIGTARVETTGEWYKIRRDQLVPHDGYYDLRVTAELWEVYYYDYLALMTVDHPVGTEIFVDERFSIPPPKLGVTTVATPHKIARAIDDRGKDVTAIVDTLDGKALDDFGRGQYQGITRDHYLEVELGDDAPKSGPLYLIGQGSIHDTESSLNVAITQGHRWRAQGMSIEVPDGHGGWVTAQANLGFPAGRKKTVLFNLTDIFRPGTPRRVRIRTNLEIYWDCIEWAQGMPDAPLKTARLAPNYADLHYRGYSSISRPDSGAPEVPDYNNVVSTKQRWRDLIGYYTRYGDVRELLTQIDDRYVIVNSGDEMSLRFPAQPAPPAGWVRDYVVIGDGWIKDGDFNSTFSKTVLPLPYHAKQEYTTRPGSLEEEWPYRQHPQDWQNYHTRYMTPAVFQNALRSDPPR
jgi:tetratricopeptide (TPR) repeat protein